MKRLHFLFLVNILAAAFSTSCSLLIVEFGKLEKSVLQDFNSMDFIITGNAMCREFRTTAIVYFFECVHQT